jgi:hypothetical protein
MHTMYSLELETSEKITQSKDSKRTKWKALEIIKKAAVLVAAALYVARVHEKRELEMKPSLSVE